MNYKSASALTAVVIAIFAVYFSVEDRPEYTFSPADFIKAEGYPTEEYFVTTADGYILHVTRIPPSKNSSSNFPILLAHGTTATSVVWLWLNSKHGLPYFLHDNGYDIWLPDFRGTRYSKNHTKLSITDPKFWDFSLDEFGRYDSPAVIDFILEKTGQDKLTFIGQSQGGTNLFIMMSHHPEYNEKINLFVSMGAAPITSPENLWSVKKNILEASLFFMKSMKWANVNELGGHPRWRDILPAIFCSSSSLTQEMCAFVSMFWIGPSTDNIPRESLDVLITHIPDSTAINVVSQFIQNMFIGKFQMMDYGEEENLQRYGEPNPPLYNISNVRCPSAIYYSKHDYLAYYKDVELTIEAMPNVIQKKLMSNFSHIDFVLSPLARSMVYPDILHLLKKDSR